MPTDILGNIDIIAAIAAIIGLFFTGYVFLKDQKTRQLQIAEDIFKNLRELEIQYYEKYHKNDENLKQWKYIFFNTLEWFSFLINHNRLKDKEMLMFFDDTFIAYYEHIFINVFEDKYINDDKQFPEFKNLYKKLKK